MAIRKMLATLVCGLAFTSAATSAEPTKLTVRVTGMFSTDREKDLREVFAEWPEVKIADIDYDRAEVVLSFDSEKLFPKAKPADVIARLDDKVRNLSNYTLGVKAVSTVPKEKLKRIEIKVAGLDCKACCLAAYEIVAKIEGVEQATASFKIGLITALIDPDKTDKAKLEAALKQRGVTLK